MNNNKLNLSLSPAAIGILLFTLLAVLLTSWYVLTQVTTSSDIQQFLPADKYSHGTQAIDKVNILKAINETNNGLFLIAIKGSDARKRATVSIKLRKQLLKTKNFIFVNNGKASLPLKDKKLLNQYRYLLSHSNDKQQLFTQQNLHNAIEQRYQELLTPFGSMVKKTIRNDPTAEFRQVLNQSRAATQPDKQHSVWVSKDQSLALLVAAINVNGMDINQQQSAISTINTAFNTLETTGMELLITGPGVFAVQAREKIKTDSQRISIMASIAVMLLILLAFRSLWLVFLAGLPLFVAVLSGVFFTHLYFNDLQGITLAFGLTLIGVALDYPVHVFSHLQQNETVKQSVEKIWPTLRLGVLTTCLGFFALTQTSFNGLAQLGIMAISGLLTAALTTRYVLPVLTDIKKPGIVSIPQWMQQISKLSLNLNLMTIAISIAVVSTLFVLYPVKWESDLAKLSPVSLEQIKIDNQLRQQLQTDDLTNVAVVRGNSADNVLVKTKQLNNFFNSLTKQKLVTAYRAAYQLLPDTNTQKMRQQLLPGTNKLKQIIQQSVTNTAFKAKTFQPFVQDIQTSKQLKPLNLKMLNGTLYGQQLSSLIFKNNNEWFGIIRFSGVSDSERLKNKIAEQNNPDLNFINIKQVSRSVIDNFRDEAIKLIFIGLVIIVLVLALFLKNTRRLLQVCFIVGLSLLATLAWLNLLGEALSLFHLISLLLVLGLGLDYSLFFTRNPAQQAERDKTSYGMAVCFGSTALVFGMLATSGIPVLNAIGLTVMTGVFFSFIFASLFSGQLQSQ